MVVPCRNEEATVTTVVEGFRASLPEARIIVYDNASQDATAELALQAGAEVVAVPQPGKGNVLRTAFTQLGADDTVDVILMVDGDATYDASRAPEMVAAVDDGHDLVFANRVGSGGGRYRMGHEAGNRLLVAILKLVFGTSPIDPLTGYRALSRRHARSLPMRAPGFATETEMNLFALSRDVHWTSLDGSYAARPPGSTSKLNTYRDGVRILWTAGIGSWRALDRDLDQPHQPQQPTVGSLATAALYALLTVLASTLLFLAANWWAVAAPADPLEHALRQALPPSEPEAEHEIATSSTLRDGREAFNDCLIPIMALERGGSTLQLVVSARRVYRYTTPQRPCDALEQLLYRGAIDPDDYAVVFYHQYWNGQRVLMRALLPVIGVDGLQALLRGGTWILLAIGTLLMFWKLATGPPEARPLAGGIACMLIAFLVGGDLARRAASFTSGPSNLLLIGFLILVGMQPTGLLRFARRNRLLLVSGLGCLLAYFALFFGTTLIGLVFLLVALALTPTAARSTAGHWRLLADTITAFLVALVGSWLLHVLLAAATFDGVLAAVLDQLHHRISGAARTTMLPELNPRYAGEHVSWPALLGRLSDNLHHVAWGHRAAAIVLLVTTVSGGLAAVVSGLRAGRNRARWIALLLALLATPIWYVTFREHTITHAGNMVRLLFLPMGVGAAAILCRTLEIRDRREA